MKQIPLSKGQFALVDDADFQWLDQWKWHLSCNGYAARSSHIPGSSQNGKIHGGKHINIFLHRLVTGAEKGFVVDHINHDKLDNRRQNLRVCLFRENTLNKLKTKGTSKYKGVCWDKRASKWVAYIHPDRKMKFLGYFISEEQAARAYDTKALELFKDFSKLNFEIATS